MKLTLHEYIEFTEGMLDRPLDREEINSIHVCNCGRTYCAGWTGNFRLDPLFVFDQPRLEL